MLNSQLNKYLLGFMAITAASINTAHAEVVAKVTDLGLPGKAFLNKEASIGKPTQEIDFLDKLELGHNVTLDADGKLTVVYFESGIEYQYAGPASFIVGANEPKNVEGEPLRVKDFKLLEKTGLKLSADQKHRDQAAMVFRAMDPYPNKVKELSPNKTKILNGSPSFSWAAIADGASYNFVLTDNLGTIEYQTTLSENHLQLPSEVVLEAESNYRWRVRTIQDDKEFVGSASFELSTETLSNSLNKSRPNITTPFSEQVVYAMLLEQEGFKYDALKQWERMAKAKPGNSAIEEKLAELSK